MRILPLVPLLVIGCGPAEALFLGTNGEPLADQPGETPADEDGDPTDEEPDEEPADEEPDEEPADEEPDEDDQPSYPLEWEGARHFTFQFQDVCDDTVFEEGIEITQEPDAQDLLAVCPECDHIFEIQVNPDAICWGYVQIRTEIVRGVQVREDGSARLVSFRWDNGGWGDDEGWVAEPLAEAEISGRKLTYEYHGNYGGAGYQVVGEAEVQ